MHSCCIKERNKSTSPRGRDLNSLLPALCAFCPASVCCMSLNLCLREGCPVNLFVPMRVCLCPHLSVSVCVYVCMSVCVT